MSATNNLPLGRRARARRFIASLARTITSIVSAPSGARTFLTGAHFVNSGTGTCYVHVFDASSATLGTTANKMHFFMRLYVPSANGIFLGACDDAFSPAETPAFTTALLAAANTTPSGATGSASPIDAQFSIR